MCLFVFDASLELFHCVTIQCRTVNAAFVSSISNQGNEFFFMHNNTFVKKIKFGVEFRR